jgi:hypothetical protein
MFLAIFYYDASIISTSYYWKHELKRKLEAIEKIKNNLIRQSNGYSHNYISRWGCHLVVKVPI